MMTPLLVLIPTRPGNRRDFSSCYHGIILLLLLLQHCPVSDATIAISSEWNPLIAGVYVRGVLVDHEHAFAKAAGGPQEERMDLWLYSFDRGMHDGVRWFIGPDIHTDSALTYVDHWSTRNPCAGNTTTRPSAHWMVHRDGNWQPDLTLTITCHGLEPGGVDACHENSSVPCIDLAGTGNGPVPMPVVMLGTAYIGPSHGASNQVIEPAPAIEVALDQGYQGLDLGSQLHPAYANERQVGELLAARPGRRKSTFLTTKLSPNEHGYQSTIRAVQRSLQLLQTDTIDLYLIHHPSCLMATECEGDWVESWRAMERLLSLGAIRAIGVSNFDYALLHHLVGGDGNDHKGIARAPVSLVQNRADPLQLEDVSVLRLCREHAINYQAFSVLGRQWNVGPWTPYWNAPHPILTHPHVVAIADRLSHETTTKTSSRTRTAVSPAQVILRWAYQKGWTVVPKTAKPDRLESNRQIFHFQLTDLDMGILDALKAPPQPSKEDEL